MTSDTPNNDPSTPATSAGSSPTLSPPEPSNDKDLDRPERTHTSPSRTATETESIDEFADLLTGRDEPLDPAFVPAERLGWWITTGVLCGTTFMALLVMIVLTGPTGWLLIPVVGWGLLTILMLWGTLSWPQIVYRHTRYLVTQQGLEIRRGVLWRTVITLPKSRTQHTDVGQGPLQRHYGIATLTTHTAGTENASVTLAGLSYDTALRIRDYLIRSTEPDAV